MTQSDIERLVDRQIAGISGAELRACIDAYRVQAYCIEGRWQYGPRRTYPCWVVLRDVQSGIGIVFCESKFGSTDQWGIIVLATASMGMDCDWHVALEHAVRNSPLWKEPNPPDYEVP